MLGLFWNVLAALLLSGGEVNVKHCVFHVGGLTDVGSRRFNNKDHDICGPMAKYVHGSYQTIILYVDELLQEQRQILH